MIFDAQEFFELALRLTDAEPNEAGYRTVVSRAYYACHLVGRETTRQKGWFQPQYDGNDHRGLIRALRGHVSWYTQLEALLRLREHVDYHTQQSHGTVGRQETCSHCSDWKAPDTLVNRETWTGAKQIAEHILPRLKQIMPAQQTH